MVLDKIKHLEKKEFVYLKVRYKVTALKDVTGRLVIKTDKRTFSYYPSEIDDFLFRIEIIDLEKEKAMLEENEYNKTIAKYSSESSVVVKEVANVVESVTEVHNAEIITSNQMTAKVSDKLFAMFETLSGKPTENTYKQAKAMVGVSNAIVNAQMAQLKFLTLKK